MNEDEVKVLTDYSYWFGYTLGLLSGVAITLYGVYIWPF